MNGWKDENLNPKMMEYTMQYKEKMTLCRDENFVFLIVKNCFLTFNQPTKNINLSTRKTGK
jgi:hypothetical protein